MPCVPPGWIWPDRGGGIDIAFARSRSSMIVSLDSESLSQVSPLASLSGDGRFVQVSWLLSIHCQCAMCGCLRQLV